MKWVSTVLVARCLSLLGNAYRFSNKQMEEKKANGPSRLQRSFVVSPLSATHLRRCSTYLRHSYPTCTRSSIYVNPLLLTRAARQDENWQKCETLSHLVQVLLITTFSFNPQFRKSTLCALRWMCVVVFSFGIDRPFEESGFRPLNIGKIFDTKTCDF